MCSIIGWVGHLPKGFLSHLLVESGSRGKDSTGIAFHGQFKEKSEEYTAIGAYKDVLDPVSFVKDEDVKKILSQARRSPMGIGHTRRASPGMPIDSKNAHPYGYWGLYFAHNGRVENWKNLKATLVEHFTGIVRDKLKESTMSMGITLSDKQIEFLVEYFVLFVLDLETNCKSLGITTRNFWSGDNEALANWILKSLSLELGFPQIVKSDFCKLPMRQLLKSADCVKYAMEITTDSQVLGPFINAKDFSLVEGCMALVWINRTSKGPEVFTMRYGKEAVSAKITWRWKQQSFTSKGKLIEESNDTELKLLTIVASTREIVEQALDKLDENIEVTAEFQAFDEGHIYKLDLCGLVDEGPVKVFDHSIEDKFSSEAV